MNNEQQTKNGRCCNPNEVSTIIACLCELKSKIRSVLECFEDYSSSTKERIALCILLEAIRKIEVKLDSPTFGLQEIKNEIVEINNIITSPTFGLQEIKNEIVEINNIITNPTFGLQEIKNEIVEINNIITDPVFGLQEIKNEICALNHPLTCAADSVQICGNPVSGGTPKRILTDTHGNISAISSAGSYNQIGRLYAVSYRYEANSTTPFSFLKIVNPPGKRNRLLYLERIAGGTRLYPINLALKYESSFSLLLIRDSVFDVPGHKIVPKNQNFGFADDSDMEVEYLYSSVGYGGIYNDIWDTTPVAGLFTIEFHGQIIVPPGHSLMLKTIGNDDDPEHHQSGLVTVVWYEI